MNCIESQDLIVGGVYREIVREVLGVFLGHIENSKGSQLWYFSHIDVKLQLSLAGTIDIKEAITLNLKHALNVNVSRSFGTIDHGSWIGPIETIEMPDSPIGIVRSNAVAYATSQFKSIMARYNLVSTQDYIISYEYNKLKGKYGRFWFMNGVNEVIAPNDEPPENTIDYYFLKQFV